LQEITVVGQHLTVLFLRIPFPQYSSASSSQPAESRC